MKIEEEVKNQVRSCWASTLALHLADFMLKMISAEAPVVLAKAAEILIEEITLRAWIHTQEGKRKTVQKSDIANAVGKNEMFDFLIDIVPRETRPSDVSASVVTMGNFSSND